MKDFDTRLPFLAEMSVGIRVILVKITSTIAAITVLEKS
jgi:hypothetical protein